MSVSISDHDDDPLIITRIRIRINQSAPIGSERSEASVSSRNYVEFTVQQEEDRDEEEDEDEEDEEDEEDLDEQQDEDQQDMNDNPLMAAYSLTTSRRIRQDEQQNEDLTTSRQIRQDEQQDEDQYSMSTERQLRRRKSNILSEQLQINGDDKYGFEAIVNDLLGLSDILIPEHLASFYESFECAVCMRPVTFEPMQHVECRNLFCASCLRKLSRRRCGCCFYDVKCPVCQQQCQLPCEPCKETRKPFARKACESCAENVGFLLPAPNSIHKHLESLQVKCPTDGCSFIDKASKLKAHLQNECLVQCSSCKTQTTFKDMTEHFCIKKDNESVKQAETT